MEPNDLLESGIAAAHQGDDARAATLLESALIELRRSNRPEQLGPCLYYLEWARANAQDRDPQPEALQAALDHVRQTPLHYLAGSCCLSLAERLPRERAEYIALLLAEAREHFGQCENWTGRARVSRIEAEIAEKHGDLEQARKSIDEALRLILLEPQGLETVRLEKRQIEKRKSKLISAHPSASV